MEDYKAQLDSLQKELNTYKSNYESLSATVNNWSGFQLQAPLDPFTRRLIGDSISDDNDYLTETSTNTVSNKRITKRVGSSASESTLTINSDSYDAYVVTALAAGCTIAAPTGTPTQGQPLLIRLKDNGTARALTWNSIFRVVGVTLPTTTVISKYNYIGAIFNSTDTKWDCIMSVQEV